MGTYTVVVSDETDAQTGTYRLYFAKVPGGLVVPGGDQGGPLTNGGNHDGTIGLGDLDICTFSANAGDNIILSVGEMTNTSANFQPQLRLFGPDGSLLDPAFGNTSAEITWLATNS